MAGDAGSAGVAGDGPADGNVTCPLALGAFHLTSLEFILPTVTLGILNVAVIIGNSLVIAAVFTSAKLRTTTNGFVCSLAVADLLVGLMVLPFSNANEVLRYWVFGPIWCSVWLAVDVWLCTASILNLVAISFDRYIAISKPFKYHNLLSPKKGKFLVGFVWILAFVICFPPLIGWNEQGKGIGDRFGDEDTTGSQFGTTSFPFNTSATDLETTGNTSLDMSSLGAGSGDGSSEKANLVTMGNDSPNVYVINVQNFQYKNFSYLFAHNISLVNLEQKRRNALESCDLRYPECGLTADPGYIIYSALGSFWIPMVIMCGFYWKIYRTAVQSTAALKKGMLTTKSGNDLSNSESVTLRIHRGGGGVISNDNKRRSCGQPSSYPRYHYRSSMSRESTLSDIDTVFVNTHSNSATRKKYREPRRHRKSKGGDVRLGSTGPQPDFPLLGKHPDDVSDFYTPRYKRKSRKHNAMETGHVHSLADEEHDLNGVEHGESKTIAFLRKARRKNIKLELQKLNKEKKAAKTVGIIVGCFILCWLPFFTVYLLGAFCQSCTPPLLFSVFFWLGYCNSAINPCVYALFSRDFRSAFKKLIRCNCRVESRHKQQLGFVSKLHSFKLQNSSRSNESNSD